MSAKPATVTVTVQVTPTPTQSTDGPPQSLAIGASVVVTSSDGKATVTLNSVERKSDPADEDADPPKLSNYIVMDMTDEATEGTASDNFDDWAVRDSYGHEDSDFTWSGL